MLIERCGYNKRAVNLTTVIFACYILCIRTIRQFTNSIAATLFIYLYLCEY